MLDETICYLCDRQFIGKNEFESHVSDVHAKIIKEDKCELCDKSFSDNHSLASHISKSHRKTPNNQCYICEKELKCSLEHHIYAMHAKIDLKVECDYCDKTFICKSGVRTHISAAHNKKTDKEKGFKCKLCGNVILSSLHETW